MTEEIQIQFWELESLGDAERAKIMRRAEQDISDLLPLAREVSDDV